MPLPRPLPDVGSIFLDARGAERALRVSWHSERDVVVLSLWRGNLCTGSFRLGIEEVPLMIDLLQSGLDRAYAGARPSAARAVSATPRAARHA